MNEKDTFKWQSMNDMELRCMEAVKKIKIKLAEIKTVSKGLPNDQQPSSSQRKVKKDVRKAKSRKRKRLHERMSTILKSAGEDIENLEQVNISEVDDTFLNSLHKRFDLNAVKELLRNGHIFHNTRVIYNLLLLLCTVVTVSCVLDVRPTDRQI